MIIIDGIIVNFVENRWLLERILRELTSSITGHLVVEPIIQHVGEKATVAKGTNHRWMSSIPLREGYLNPKHDKSPNMIFGLKP